jgi:alkanesulfonate monooxygenase SsuD/methylene tetrahydromethanopterin reductase-like flavin-dependent oxidoreductase (luciferase family)
VSPAPPRLSDMAAQLRKRPLKIGLMLPIGEGWLGGGMAGWSELKNMAQHAEALGFDSLWVPDHLLFEFGEAGEPPHGQWEAWSLLAALAASTQRVELGPLVLCTGFRNPALLAKMADTLDEISGGRLILGLGAGYHEREFRAFGYPYDHRVSRFAEALQIIRTLLRVGTIDFQGRYYEARACELRPRGPRPEGPPILIGAPPRLPRMLRLTAEYADYWNGWSINHLEALTQARAAVDAACTVAGRDPATLQRTTTVLIDLPGAERNPAPEWVRRYRSLFAAPVTGSTQEIAALLKGFAVEGVSHVQVWLEPNTMAGIDALAPVLDLLDRG